jgi:hypothetical protein
MNYHSRSRFCAYAKRGTISVLENKFYIVAILGRKVAS